MQPFFLGFILPFIVGAVYGIMGKARNPGLYMRGGIFLALGVVIALRTVAVFGHIELHQLWLSYFYLFVIPYFIVGRGAMFWFRANLN